ncbi:MAG: hypothetical protein AAGE01_06985 [Pseudomonadota bacterium]
MKLSKLVGLVLGAGCALLGLIGVVQVTGLGSRVSPASAEDATAPPPPDLTLTTPFALAEEQNYAMIAERPLFNEDRKPDPNAGVQGPEDPENEGQGGPDEPLPPLEVDVKGIIIGPEVRVAIVTDPKSKSTQRLKEGMPLEGELAAWTLDEIQPRTLVFAGEGDETAEVTLEVHKGALAGGPPVRARQTANDDEASEAGEPVQADSDAQGDPEARAEEIRRRVAERRAQLRAEAERRRAEREEDNDN